MHILCLLILLLAPSLASAAYPDSATVLRYEQDQNGAARLIMRFTGNAGEPIVDRPYHIAANSTVALLQQWVRGVVTELNLARTAGTHPSVVSGTVITGAAASAPAPTARSVWKAKVQMHGQACSQSFTGAIATACSALKTDIETTYQAGFLDVSN